MMSLIAVLSCICLRVSGEGLFFPVTSIAALNLLGVRSSNNFPAIIIIQTEEQGTVRSQVSCCFYCVLYLTRSDWSVSDQKFKFLAVRGPCRLCSGPLSGPVFRGPWSKVRKLNSTDVKSTCGRSD
jgi:hypothetical protein